jgi:hypothetical protein
MSAVSYSGATTGNSINVAEILGLGAIITLLFNRNRAFTKDLLARVAPESRFRSRLAETVWPKVNELTLLDQFRADHLACYFQQAVDKPGDIIECGVYQGGTSLLLASMLQLYGIRKKVYLLDSFAGLPAPDRRFDSYYSAGWLRADEKTLRSHIERLGLSSYCVVKKGWFKDTLKEMGENQRFCFVHVDCDLYDSCNDCLTYLYPKVVDGAPIVFDDYYDSSGGVQKAVDAWTARTREIIHLGPAPQATIIKGMTHADQPGSVVYSTSHLEGNLPYMRYLEGMSELLSEVAEEFSVFAQILSGREGSPSLRSKAFAPLFQALLGS